MTVIVVLEKTDNHWGAFTPDDIGCMVACGDTRDETLALFREALQSHLRAMRDSGLLVPVMTAIEVRETPPLTEALAA